MPDTGNETTTNFSIFKIKNVTWQTVFVEYTRTKETVNAYTSTKPVQLVYNKSFVDQFIF